jgi:hypothetical protein
VLDPARHLTLLGARARLGQRGGRQRERVAGGRGHLRAFVAGAGAVLQPAHHGGCGDQQRGDRDDGQHGRGPQPGDEDDTAAAGGAAARGGDQLALEIGNEVARAPFSFIRARRPASPRETRLRTTASEVRVVRAISA